MQAIQSGYLLRQNAVACMAALLLPLAGTTQAQTSAPAEEIPDDYYRAELVILKRQIAPEAVDEVMAGAELYRASDCDVIVAIGGGSPMDCAKGIGIVCVQIEGKRDDIKKAIAWLESKGVNVEPVEIDAIAG